MSVLYVHCIFIDQILSAAYLFMIKFEVILQKLGREITKETSLFDIIASNRVILQICDFTPPIACFCDPCLPLPCWLL